MQLSKLVKDTLGDALLSDMIETEAGYLAQHSPEIAEFAYQIKINKPTSPEGIDFILGISNGANPEAIKNLYSQMNGLNLMMSKFFIYGYRTSLNRADYNAIQNVPFDIEQIQTYGRPEFAPENSCVVAKFYEDDAEEADPLLDCIDSQGRVISGFYLSSP